MKRWIRILVGVLAVQAALYLFLSYQDFNASKAPKAEALLTLNLDKTDKIWVEEAGKKVELLRKDGKWILPELFNFPVSAEKISQIFKKIMDEKKGYPAGNTKVAAKQFEVTDEKFERKVTFFAADKVENTLYLGSSPSFHKVYARVNQEDKTYSIELNTFEVPTAAMEWVDRDVYKVDRTKVAQIRFPDFALQREGTALILSELKADETTNTTEVDAFLSKLANPFFEEVLSTGAYETDAKLLEYTVVNEDKSERVYTYFGMKAGAKAVKDAKAADSKKENEFAVLKVSDLPYYFSLRKMRVDELLKMNRTQFIQKKSASAKTGDLKEAGQSVKPGPG